MRGVGAVEALRALPDALVVLFALVTQLGDVWFVFVLLVLLYWGGDPSVWLSRPRAAFVLALALGALALTTGLKQLFGLPRPPMAGDPTGLRYVPTVFHELYLNAATADGYGFPSGHALTTTVVWGGLAVVLDVGTRRRRALVAGTVIALVCLSRVALGIHYAVDVVAGVAVGLAYLGVTGRRRARTAFWLAVAIAVVSVFVGSVTFDDAAALGATVGAAVTWERIRGRMPTQAPRLNHLAVAVGLVVLGGGFGAVYLLEPPLPVTALVSGVVLAGMLALPLVVERLRTFRGSARSPTR